MGLEGPRFAPRRRGPSTFTVRGDTVSTVTEEVTVADQNQVRPNYGAQPRGKPNIMRQGQTEAGAFGQDPNATGNIPPTRDNPNLGSGA
jgi:hypothetical protein